MAQLTSIEITDSKMLKDARKNDREIRKNIPRLVHILLHNDQLRTKLEREFGSITKTTNEMKIFNEHFRELCKLW